jgi:predicted ATP-grasp superfamily ATP-dependent carboligase
MRVLVLDGNQNQAVACVRSLSQAGHTVMAGESATWSKAGWSRHCHGTFQYLSPQSNAGDFVRSVVKIAEAEPGTFLLPCTEITTLALSAHRDLVLAGGSRIILPGHAELLRAFDKKETTQLACSLGIRVPMTIELSSEHDMHDQNGSVPYPVVLKPRRSTELAADGRIQIGGRPRYARNPAELHVAFAQLGSGKRSTLMQEFVQGEGLGYFALVRRGEVYAEFAHRRIRDVYPSGSGSALRVSVKLDPAIREAGRAILKALSWHGVAMVEFRQRSGEIPVFIEVNGRLWHSLALACYAGADFPAWLAQMAEHGNLPPAPEYRVGIPCRWWLGDARHLIEVWRGAPPGYAEKFPSRLKTLLTELWPVAGAYHDNFRWDDPLPEIGDWLSFAHRLTDDRKEATDA